MREERRWHLHGFRFVVHNKGFLVSISFSSVHLLQIRNMKKRLTIILKSSISGGARALAKRKMSHVKQK